MTTTRGEVEALALALKAYNDVWQSFPDIDASNVEECRSLAMQAALRRSSPMLGREAVVWRVLCTNNGATGYLYTEALPFDPGPGVHVRKEPEPLYALSTPAGDSGREAVIDPVMGTRAEADAKLLAAYEYWLQYQGALIAPAKEHRRREAEGREAGNRFIAAAGLVGWHMKTAAALTPPDAGGNLHNLVDWVHLYSLEGASWLDEDVRNKLIELSARAPTQQDADRFKLGTSLRYFNANSDATPPNAGAASTVARADGGGAA